MIIKPRYESLQLKLLRYLNLRMNLSANETANYLNLDKGFKGEQKFDEWLAKLPDDWLVLNDLIFDINNTTVQIDTLIISPAKIYLFEVKNYQGDFFIEADQWYSISKSEIKNPLLQLNRTVSLLRRLLQDLGTSTSIEAYLVFVNPDFYLYHAPINLPIIFPTQLNRFMNKLNMRSSKIRDSHSKIAEQLLSIHLNESPYMRLPDYGYDQLKKGITCPCCHSYIAYFIRKTLVCNECGSSEDVEMAVLRSIEEFQILFPDRKITTYTIHEWCKIIKSKKTIRRILSINLKLIRLGKSSYYINTPVTNND